jgi:hypothetical protein
MPTEKPDAACMESLTTIARSNFEKALMDTSEGEADADFVAPPQQSPLQKSSV